MAVIPIPNRYEGFIFNGENSRTYGVYITEPAVFDAPERDAELITIPGRNGQLIQDNGRWENIQVTYHCALPTNSEADFIQGVQDFRNMLASNIGYQRLEDEINTDEYRMGAFVSGLGVETINKSAGTFDVVFTCQPQRYLTSGETAVEITSGDTITNPTAYEARPTLQVWGYGNISIGGQNLSIFDTTIGNVQLYPATTSDVYFYGAINEDVLETGDTITIKDVQFSTDFVASQEIFTTVGAPTVTGTPVDNWRATVIHKTGVYLRYGWDELTFNIGTTSTVTSSISATVMPSYSLILQLSAKYDADDRSITIQSNVKGTSTILDVTTYTEAVKFSSISGYSTKTALGAPLYFDLDVGEAYVVEGGVPVSVNNAVTIPAKLPTLKPGGNTITYDNTITQFKVVPGWWRL